MAGVFEHYRVSTLGQELRECLEEMVENDELDSKQFDLIFQQFDKAICSALSSDVKSKAVIRGPMHHYRNHDDIWTVRVLHMSTSDSRNCLCGHRCSKCTDYLPLIFLLLLPRSGSYLLSCDVAQFMLKSINVKLDTSFTVASGERTNIISVTKR